MIRSRSRRGVERNALLRCGEFTYSEILKGLSARLQGRGADLDLIGCADSFFLTRGTT